MNKQFYKDTLGRGFLLWFIGYLLGIILFPLVPSNLIGIIITPIGTAVTLWILIKKIKSTSYLPLAIIWTLIAIICDYFFLVKLFNPADGYYKLDIYLYYIITFALPLIIGQAKKKKNQTI